MLDKKVYNAVLNGSCNLKLLVFEKIKDELFEMKEKKVNNDEIVFLKYKTYAEVVIDFLATEI